MTARSADSRRLVLILDEHQDRLDAAAKAIAETAPHARMLLASAVKDSSAADGPPPDVILVRTDPDGWAAASVLAAHRPPLPGRPVDAFLVAEGPLDKFSVLVTDFPGLRLLPPRAGLAAVLAGLVRAAIRDNAGALPAVVSQRNGDLACLDEARQVRWLPSLEQEGTGEVIDGPIELHEKLNARHIPSGRGQRICG